MVTSLNERVFDALMAAGLRDLADEYAENNGGDEPEFRTLVAQAVPLEADRILALHQQFGTAEVKDSSISWAHNFGFGGSAISMEVTLPDGARVTETINIHDLLTTWAKQVLNENGVQ